MAVNVGKKIVPNAQQQICIDNFNGKFLVLAGPGTGKTFTIVQRIKNMIGKGVQPEKILCLTFTETASNEMQKRINDELCSLDSGVNIFTYHGLCCNIIENNIEDFDIPARFKIISESVSRKFIKDCIDEINPVYHRNDRNDPYPYIEEIKFRIDEIKKNRLTKEQYFYNLEHNKQWQPYLAELRQKRDDIISGKNKRAKLENAVKNIEEHEKTIEKAKELWTFYEKYQDKMYQNHYIDFNDMISVVLDKFEKNPTFLEKIANEYEYILVDEYQDTNKAQNTIVFHLTHALKTENIFVVGDDDQIIYSFQGAKLDTIEKFLKEFPNTKVICLQENMRSTQKILHVARKITEQDDNRLENKSEFKQYNINKELVAKNADLFDKNRSVRCYFYADMMQEYNEIVREIVALVNSENCPKDKNGEKKLSEIAILAKSNAELETFAEMLKCQNIPFELKDGKSIFTIKSSLVLYYYLQILANPEKYSDKFLKLLLLPPFSIHPKDYMKIQEKVSVNKFFLDSMKELLASCETLIEPEKLKNFVTTFEYLFNYQANENLHNIILEIGAKTGIFNYYINEKINRTENIAGLKKVVDEAVAFSEISISIGVMAFVEYLDMALEDDMEIKTEKSPVPMNAIQLSTYHSSKGREFEYVYMPTLLRHKWESSSKSVAPSIPLAPEEYKTEDELKACKFSDCVKVLYVGMTRAKHTLRLSYCKTNSERYSHPTKLIANIADMFEREETPFVYDENSFWNEISSSLTKCDYDYEKDFSALLDHVISNKNFSPSSVNTYLKCPRQYLYGQILNLATPYGNADNLNFGSAIHKACELAIEKALQENAYPTKEQFVKFFIDSLSMFSISDFSHRKILEERGKSALENYYKYLISTPISSIFASEKELLVQDEGLNFKGKIDRIDKCDDGTFAIYDYKTGKPKDGKVICPNGEYEDYYNQIGLYKYYFELETGKKVSKVEFIYPEFPNDNYTLELSQEECLAIIEKFKGAVSDIKAHKFAPISERKKDKSPCKYCQYREFCDFNIV